MMKEIIFFSAIIGIIVAEAPISAPYPPSGWRPKGAPFTLPKEFLPQQATDFEVTKERVDYAGQLAETTTIPSNSYLPPEVDEDTEDDGQTTEDLLKVQGLPSNEPSQFNQNGQFPSNNNFFQNNNQQNGQLRQFQQRNRQQFAKTQQFGRIQQQQQFNGQFNYQQQQQQQQQQQPQLGQQSEQQFGQNAVQQEQQFNGQEGFRKGSRPQFNSFPGQFGPRQTPAQEYGPPRTENDAENDDEDEGFNNQAQIASAAANQLNEQPRVGAIMALSNGRYYVLTPDNTLQRVVFMTTQDEEEARTNGFTAQLRYMPVEPIRDPIYAYNEQGQLIKIFKK